jgi:hypothetical protein
MLLCAEHLSNVLPNLLTAPQATFKYNPENKCVELVVDRDYQPGAACMLSNWAIGVCHTPAVGIVLVCSWCLCSVSHTVELFVDRNQVFLARWVS